MNKNVNNRTDSAEYRLSVASITPAHIGLTIKGSIITVVSGLEM